MNTNRRKFLCTSALGLVGVNLFSSFKFNSFFLPVKYGNNLIINQTIPQLLRQAAIKRRNGELIESQQLYQQIINIDSNEIRAYDGLRKLLLLDKYKELEVIQLYSSGFNSNPNNPIFQERLSKEYMRLSLGNKKFANQLNSQGDLLVLAKSSLNQLRNNYPDNEQFEELFKKAKRKENQNANTLDARANNDLKEYKKDKRKRYKKRFNDLDVNLIEAKLILLLDKPSNNKRIKHIKELYRIIIRKLSKSNNELLACQKSRDLFLYDNLDVNSLRIARKFCKKHKQFGILEDIERNNDTNKNTFWSKVSLFDTLIKRYNKENVGSVNEMNSILDSAYSLKFNPIHTYEIESRKFKLFLINNSAQALIQLTEFGKKINGISSAHYIDRYNVLCVKYFKKIGNIEKALMVLNIASMDVVKEPEDDFLKLVFHINSGKDNINPIHLEKINHLKNKLMSN